MLSKIAHLEYLAFSIKSLSDVAESVTAGINPEDEFHRGVIAGRKMITDNLAPYAAELEALVEEIKQITHAPYMVEDVDFYREEKKIG